MTNDGTLKVTPITAAASQQAYATFTITATIDGFPVQIAVEGKADALRGMIDRLKAIGAEPPQAASKQANAAGTPLCPVHGSKMKPSKKPGSYFCPRQAEDGNGYCPEKA